MRKILSFKLLLLLLLSFWGCMPRISYRGKGLQYMNQSNLKVFRDDVNPKPYFHKGHIIHAVALIPFWIDEHGNGIYYYGHASPSLLLRKFLHPMVRCNDQIVFFDENFEGMSILLMLSCVEDKNIQRAVREVAQKPNLEARMVKPFEMELKSKFVKNGND